MTDKQIIIDGVDVSECPYYIDSEGVCSSHDCECVKCVHNECFYKDYKRKEQECKNNKTAYQMELDIFNQECLNLLEELKAKEQECEAYKMEAEEGKEINAELKAENKHINDLLNQALKELEKTRETLTEIKEIAEKARDNLYTCESISYADDDLRDILQKISECEGNDGN